MQLAELISVERIACNVETASKKRALELLSELVCHASATLVPTEVFESLIAREKLGSTGLGKGVAIPHGRLKSGDETIVAFMQLAEGVDFDSPDGQPVDLLCALMVPPESTEEHLQILAQLSEIFRQEDLRDQLRAAQSEQALCKLLTQSSTSSDSE